MPSSKGLYSKQFVCDLFDFDTPELGFYFPIDIDQIWKARQSSTEPKNVGLS